MAQKKSKSKRKSSRQKNKRKQGGFRRSAGTPNRKFSAPARSRTNKKKNHSTNNDAGSRLFILTIAIAVLVITIINDFNPILEDYMIVKYGLTGLLTLFWIYYFIKWKDN